MPKNDLANKYRPRKFADVLGQSAVVASMRGVIERKSSHAFVLTGPSGVGKTTLARIAARALGCDRLNIVEVDGATNNGVEHWKILVDGLRYLPLAGDVPNKAVLVDECHALSKPAWQSLLKPVEEPPEHVFWFFLTTEGGKIPNTIMTRCARFDLAPIKSDDILDMLQKVCDAEGGGPPRKVLAMVSRNANGSAREALTALAACWDAKDQEAAAALLRTVDENPDVIAICRGLLRNDLSWAGAVAILSGIEGANPESLRHVTQAYFAKVAMGAKTPEAASKALTLLEPFVAPYPPGTSLAPYLLSLGKILFEHDEGK